ncbi:GLUG motif-containing protein [Paenibacillus massiliensis]|uniref:GLUG motif-containing protein n=1 Tax=Paenibacillus massiliensis TaxID=225917 RepID=UPI000367B172|nr:GLUG motif-containing protein [Paenibacillus massiliensis]
MADSVIRNYTIEVDKRKNKSTFKLYSYPVEVLTPAGWANIYDEYADLVEKSATQELTEVEARSLREYQDLTVAFEENKLAETIIFDTADPNGIEILGRDRVQHVLEAETKAEIPFLREFAYVHGASNISGTIVLPYDDYSDVYVVSDADEDGVAELTFVKDKEETGGERPYYEKKGGKTYIYVNHFSGGGGTQASPYIVSNEQELNKVRNNLGAWYKQDRDIVMGSFQTGAGFVPIGTTSAGWMGEYDGNGYSIKSLFINSTVQYTGLFGYVYGGTVRNLRLVDPNITCSSSRVGSFMGGGYNPVIQNCNVIGGSVTGVGTVGGIVGYALADNRYSGNGVVINFCYSYKCNVRTSGNVAGGIIGQFQYGYAGSSYLANCFSTGVVEDITLAMDKANIGGLAGLADSNQYISYYDNYWDMEKSKCGNSAVGIGLSTADAKKASSYVNWNFDIYWYIDEEYNEGYPEHRQFVYFKHGKGTQAEPFVITTEFELNQIRWWRKGFYFRFEDDLKMIDHQTGKGFYPIGFALVGKDNNCQAFIDGGNRSIANLFISRLGDSHVSLFGAITSGWVKNLDIIDCNISGGQFTSVFGSVTNATISNCHSDTFNASKVSGTYVGGLVGNLTTGAVIEDCSANVVTSSSDCVGAFVGNIYNNAIIRRCYASGRTENTGGYLGGFVGVVQAGSTFLIEDCFTNAELNGTIIGLVVGYFNRSNQGSIIKRFVAYCKAYGTSSVSSYYGYNYTNSELPATTEYYWDKTINGGKVGANTGSIGKSTVEMKHPSTYKNWDMANIWLLDEKYNTGYPTLRDLLIPDPPILGFRNEFGKYYTDPQGNILRYLDFGTLVASQTGLPKAVWLQNNAEFSVNSMKVFIDLNTVVQGMTVDLSLSESPFVPLDEINFGGTFSKGSSAKFFVRLSSDISVKTGGTFDLRAKASPV